MTAEHDVSFATNRLGGRAAKTLFFLVTLGLLVLATKTEATVSREQDIVELRLGQRVKVDDGSCPAGQIKEVSGTKMTETGVLRGRKCIPRVGPKVK
ncbi:MAG: DUF6719 family protein [Bradyrhizobium sp.]